MTAVSKTDKTRPHWVKVKEYGEAYWRPEFRCGHTCHCSNWWWEQQKDKDRTARKAAARNWEKDYE